MTNIKGSKRVFFGTRKADKARIYLERPEWQCGWYWAFGWMGNSHEHFHLNGYQAKEHFLKFADGSYDHYTEQRNKHMHDCLLEDYDLAPEIEKNLWTFCELALTAYALKEAAEVLGRGGSHTTTNPCVEIIINTEETKRINEVVLPAIFNAISDILEPEAA